MKRTVLSQVEGQGLAVEPFDMERGALTEVLLVLFVVPGLESSQLHVPGKDVANK